MKTVENQSKYQKLKLKNIIDNLKIKLLQIEDENQKTFTAYSQIKR